MIIPKEIIVGYQTRLDSFGHRLGFITAMYDGKMKFENAFKNWVKEEPDTFTNEPTSGIIVNFANPCSYGDREAFVRLWDPRGFEFEITLNNFMELLLNNSMEEGGVLKGEFVYGWEDSIAKRIKLIQPNKVENFDTIIKISNDFVRRYTTTQIKKELNKKTINIIKDDEYAILRYGYYSKSVTTFIETARGGYTEKEYIKGFHECLSVDVLIDKYNEILKDISFYENFELYIFKK